MSEEKNKVKSESKYEHSFEYIRRKLEGKKDSFGKLVKEVIRTGVCTHCGTCAAICSALEWDPIYDEPRLVGQCSGCGICYNQCPRTITNPEQLVGLFKTGYVTKSGIPEVIGGQDGGTVTSLLCYLFDENLIDGAVVTKENPNKPWVPLPQLITTKEEAIEAAGSIYSHSQTVDSLMDGIRNDMGSIAFVGTPCNIDAVFKMESSPLGMLKYFMRAHVFKIGLFCMDSFSHEALLPFFEKEGINLAEITKMDINKGRFYLYKGDTEVKSYKIKELDKFKSSSCNFCTDLAAENADISVGSVGSGPMKNTVLARSGIGVEIMEDAIKKGYLLSEPFSVENLNSVLFLARLKKVSQYTVLKRKVFIVKDIDREEPFKPRPELKEEAEVTRPFGTRKILRVTQKLNESQTATTITIENVIGYLLENLQIRVAIVEELFEKRPWSTTIKEIFPFESIQINYPLEIKDGKHVLGEIIIDISDSHKKLFFKKYSLKPKEKKSQ